VAGNEFLAVHEEVEIDAFCDNSTKLNWNGVSYKTSQRSHLIWLAGFHELVAFRKRLEKSRFP